MSRMMKSFLDNVVIPPCRKVRALQRLANYVSRAVSDEGYPHLRERFIANGDHGPWSRKVRAEIVSRFEAVDRRSDMETSTPAEGLALAEGPRAGVVSSRGDVAGWPLHRLLSV